MFNNTAGANTNVSVDFNANSTKYASIKGGYGLSQPFMSFEVGNTPTEKMIIQDSGNVGIGTTTPSAKLEVAGDAIVETQISAKGGANILTSGGGTINS